MRARHDTGRLGQRLDLAMRADEVSGREHRRHDRAGRRADDTIGRLDRHAVLREPAQVPEQPRDEHDAAAPEHEAPIDARAVAGVERDRLGEPVVPTA